MLNHRGKKRILITGANGFIGGALWKYLTRKEKDFEIFGLISRGKSAFGRLYPCDFGSSKNIKLALEKIYPSCIFHCVGGRAGSPKKQIQLNYHLTKNLFDAVKSIRNFSPRIIIPGSAAEYGRMPKGRRLLKENDPLHPTTSYGQAKKRQMQMVLKYARQGFDVVVARIFNVFGEGTPAALSVGHFSWQIAMIEKKKKQPTIQTGPLTAGRDFIDIEDVCAGLVCLMKYGKRGEVYNLCSGKKVMMKELLRKLVSLSRVKKITIEENESQGEPLFDVIGSNVKIKSLNHWHPRMNLERSLKNTLATYRRSPLAVHSA